MINSSIKGMEKSKKPGMKKFPQGHLICIKWPASRCQATVGLYWFNPKEPKLFVGEPKPNRIVPVPDLVSTMLEIYTYFR